MMKIEVAYATPEKQQIVEIDVEDGTTLRAAALQSGLELDFPDIDLAGAPLGLFGKKVPKPDVQVLKAGDRVEVYRPLIIDPKQSRLNRAAKTKKDASK